MKDNEQTASTKQSNENIKSKVVKSAKWTTVQSIVNMAYGPLYKIFMAMVISPEGFAYVSAILVMLNIGDLLTRIGFSQALIVEKESGSKQFSTVFWIDVASALVMSAAIMIAAPGFEIFYGLEELKEMIFLVAPCVLLAGMTRTFRCYLQKELRHDTIVKIDIFRVVLDSVCTIALILVTDSLIGYVLGTLISRFVSLVCFVYCAFRQGYRMGFYFDVEFLKKIKGFSASVTVRNIMDYIVSIADELIIARLFADKSVLGMYFFAKDLIAKPQAVIAAAVSQIALSTLAKFADDLKKLAALFLKMSKLLALASFPVFLGLALTSTEFLPLLFGKEYAGAVLYIYCFSINAMFSTITTSPGSAVLYSVRKPNVLLGIDIINSIIYLSLLLILGRFGVLYVVVAKMVSMCFSVVATNISSRHNLDVTFGKYVVNLKNEILATLVMAAGVIAVKLIVPESMNMWIELMVSVLTGAMVYVLVLLKKRT